MTRIALKLSVALIAASAPAAAQEMPRPWQPGFVMPAAPAPPDPQARIIPFGEKIKAMTSLPPLPMPGTNPLTIRDTPPAMNTWAFPVSRASVMKCATAFPALGEDFEVIEEGTRDPRLILKVIGKNNAPPGTYNCIAWTTGIKNVWVDPYPNMIAWDLYYEGPGYTRCRLPDTRKQAGFQKVAVYATTGTDGRWNYTHAAIQENDGTWSSKLGQGPLIRHRTAESVAGPDYGEVVLVYARKK